MQSRDYAPRWEAYRLGLDMFRRGVELQGLAVEFVDIPYEGSTYPALFVPAPPRDGRPAPVLVSCNGLDSMKEQIFSAGNPAAFAARGVSTLVIDQPGTGAALRLAGLVGRHDSEAWASKAVDYLLTRDDVDPKRIGMFGLSLGGYFAPRAAAFEKRLALCAVMGANHNWGEMQKRRQAREGDRPVPHYWDHVLWVFGKTTVEEFMEWAPAMDLNGVVDRIDVPFLVTHGEGDRQIPVEYAHQSYEQAVNSPKRELHITTKSDSRSSIAAPTTAPCCATTAPTGSARPSRRCRAQAPSSQGLTTRTPTPRNGVTSRVATVKPLTSVMAAIWQSGMEMAMPTARARPASAP